MKYLPFRPLFDFKPFGWDEEEWPEYKMTDGLNVFEEDGKVTVEAAVPGVDPKNVKVTYEDGVLRVAARIEENKNEKKAGRVVHQWSKVASFDYTTYLPRPIDTKTIDAKVKDGVLTMTAKIAEEAKPKEIEVKIG